MSLSSKKSDQCYNRAKEKLDVNRTLNPVTGIYDDDDVGYDWDLNCDCQICSPKYGVGNYFWGKLLTLMVKLRLKQAVPVEKEIW
jgi:hypothetical protein